MSTQISFLVFLNSIPKLFGDAIRLVVEGWVVNLDRLSLVILNAVEESLVDIVRDYLTVKRIVL